MINTNQYDNFISSITIKIAMFAFFFLVGTIYFNSITVTTEKTLLSVVAIITLFSALFLVFRRDFVKYDTTLSKQIYINSFYKTVVSNSPLALIVTDGNKITFYNDAARKLFNKNKKFLETTTIAELIYHEDRNKFKEIIEASNSVENVILRINKKNNEYDFVRPEYNYANFSVQKQLFSGQDRYVIFVYEITEHLNHLNDIIEKSDIYESMCNSSPRTIYIFDTNGKMHWQNTNAKKTQSFDFGENFAGLIEYDINRNLLNSGFQIATAGDTYQSEKIVKRNEDFDEWVNVKLAPLWTEKGNQYIQYSIDNITASKQQIDEYKRQIHINSESFDKTKNAQVIWNANGEFVKANKQLYELFRLTPGVFAGKLNLFKNNDFLAQLINELIFNNDDLTKRTVYTKKSIKQGFKKYFEHFLHSATFEVIMNLDVSRLSEQDIDNNNDDSDDDFDKNVIEYKNIWIRNYSYPLFDSYGKLTCYVSEFYDITDYYILQNKFKLNKTHLDAIANNFSSGIILIIDTAHNVVFLGGENAIMRKIHSKGFNPLRRAFDFSAIPEFDIFRDNILEALEGNISKISSLKMFENSYDMQFFPIRDSNNKIQHCIAIGFNVVDREKFETELVSQKNFLEKTFSESTIPAIVVDINGKYVKANTKFFEFMGFDREQVLNSDIYSADSWLNKEIIVESFEKILSGAESLQFEIEEEKVFSFYGNRNNDDFLGNEEIFKFTLIGKCYPILDARKNIESVIFNFIDISDNRRILEAMKSANAINDAITKNLPNSILIMLDKNKKVILYEGGYEIKLIKMEDVKVLGRNIYDVDAPLIVAIRPYLTNVINTKFEAHFDFELEVTDDEGNSSEINYEIYLIPILDFYKEIEYIFIHFSNITNRKQLEKAIVAFNAKLENDIADRTAELRKTTQELENYVIELQATQKELEMTKAELSTNLNKEVELNQMKSQFINLMSHEFRTPLTVIQTCAFLMGSYYDMQAKDKFDVSLNKITTAIDMMTKLLDNVLFLDDVRSKTAQFVNIEVVTFVKTVVEEVVVVLKSEQNISINTNVNELFMLTDEKFLREIVTNILSNAIKYSSKTSEIIVDLINEETKLIITFTDFGSGIADDIVDGVFETFTRSANVTNISGSGLGLSIVKNCVELLYGEITFETAKGVGTKFTVTLPKLNEKDIYYASMLEE